MFEWNYFEIQFVTIMKFSRNYIFFSLIELNSTLIWYEEAQFSNLVHMTPDRNQNMINAMRHSYILAHFIGSF